MEKTGNYEFVIYKENGVLKLRHPGGLITSYDNRFGDYSFINEGEQVVKTNED